MNNQHPNNIGDRNQKKEKNMFMKRFITLLIFAVMIFFEVSVGVTTSGAFTILNGDPADWTVINDVYRSENASISSQITLTLTPPSNTTVSKGSKLGPFSISITNNTSSSYTSYVYIYLYTPDGNGRTIMSRQMTLSGGKTLSANNLYLNIPSTAPAGTYSYYVNIYDTSYNLLAQDGFAFSVVSSITPSAGKWSGSNIEFNVSTDSSKITSTGSSITSNGKSYALKLGPLYGSCGTITWYIASDIPISNQSFEYNSSDMKITGSFTSSSTSSGTYSISNYYIYGCGYISASGNWSASPATSSSVQGSNSISHIDYEYNPITGDVVEITK